MLITTFVFIGIEGASVYSRYAQKRSEVGVATIFGFIGVTALMVLVTLLSYAVLPRAEIAGLQQPSMATVLEAVVGHWGLVFISLGVIVSVLGAYLAWQMIAAACCTPRSTVKWKIQMPIDEITTAASVSPLPKIGKNAPSVDLISTQ